MYKRRSVNCRACLMDRGLRDMRTGHSVEALGEWSVNPS